LDNLGLLDLDALGLDLDLDPAPRERPRESESEEHKAGPWEFTPCSPCIAHLCLCGFDDDLDNPHGDYWLDFG
jgi:hypothetical protein